MSSREFRLAVSLRVDRAPGHGERRDGLAHDWFALFDAWQVTPLLVPNRTPASVDWLSDLEVDGVLLTGGNTPVTATVVADDAAPERDAVEAALVDFARARKLPILGVCRGAQFLATQFGARLVAVDGHVGARHEIEWRRARHLHRTTVNSFHGWALCPDDFPDVLRVLATSADGTVEAFEHVEKPIAGVVWHPERPGADDPVLREFVQRFLIRRPTTEVV